MFLNSSIPQPANQPTHKGDRTISSDRQPDYAKLAQFLIQPFLESPNSLSVDCEFFPSTAKVWLRVAFEGEDKGRVFGRGGRNIQNIRTVIAAAAAMSGHSVYLDIYGSQAFNGATSGEETGRSSDRSSAPKLREQRGESPKPVQKPRSH
ncbi:KH domain-containing protein [Chroococcidiopsis sp. FACHB-1243]|uniref:KH domain-containing protein n=1 Tax=Chroococcidiopsis sp. [FACHB-1243] TaxID=2692781 RepID=UPI00177AB64F|nr:KH domain-containing protein [Chroococcidiopsis sp. [FACHB-1243]]MBD2305302.1 KH domain-containing protein [Chroococcidiopsis sp. [FACHB-1243]]